MTDYISAGSAKIWELLLASSAFTDAVRSTTKFNQGKLAPERKNKAPGDLPNAKLRAASFQSQGFTGNGSMRTFGNTAPTNNTDCDFVIEKLVTYELTITYDGVDETKAGLIETATEAALYAAGIKLGVTQAKTWGPISGRYEQKKTDAADGTLRLVQTIQIPVLFRLRRADIIP